MPYLSVSNFWKYQNADVWKKSKGHPPWFKHWVHRDRELDALPPLARLLWVELLGAATRYENVLGIQPDVTGLNESEAKLKESVANLNWICSEVRMEPDAVAELLPLLVKGGWINETKTKKRSRKLSRENRDESLEPIRTEEETETEEPKSVVLPSSLEPPDQKRSETTDAAGLERIDARETLEELGARLAAQAAPVGSEARLFEVLPDMDEQSPTVLRALLETLPAHTIELVRDEVLANRPRRPTAYAVDLLKKRQRRVLA